MESGRQRALITFAALLLIVGSSTAGAIEVGEVTVEYRKDRYHLFGESVIDAPSDFIHDVLTDYDHFYLMAEGVAETKFLIEDGERLGYTRIDTCILFFCRAVEKVERLEVEDKKTFVAEAIPERSHYRISKTRWQLEPAEKGTKVTYIAEVRPNFWLPTAIGVWAIRKTLRQSANNIGSNIEYLHQNKLTLQQYAKLQESK